MNANHPNPFLRPKQFDNYYEREMAEQNAKNQALTNKLLMSTIGMGVQNVVRNSNAKPNQLQVQPSINRPMSGPGFGGFG